MTDAESKVETRQPPSSRDDTASIVGRRRGAIYTHRGSLRAIHTRCGSLAEQMLGLIRS